MIQPTYCLTRTALSHFEEVIRETARRWGWRQAESYRDALLAGFDGIAKDNLASRPSRRQAIAQGTDFSLHLVEHHYVCFIRRDHASVIVAGLFHERMNIPVRLKELQALSSGEIAALQATIGRDAPLRQ
ncbi:type II toxin-antitoxin system RelE/ParE family toxin [Variovorax sp. RHLX14]|uniref:type II toxin-antitoxin system RelE/ParE family toxin n=1 Tax=Variovorax sp. RHLX14 TaxID=1259731 RepID=UPI003F47DB71